MKRAHSLQLLLALFVFTLDVKVRARVIELPHGCVKGEAACAVLNLSGVLKKKMVWGDLRVSEGGSYLITSANQLRLIRGHFFVEAHEPIEVSTLYGVFKVKFGRAFFDVRDQIVNFTNVSSSDFKYQPRGDQQDYELPVGFANYLTLISTNGAAEAGYPKIAELKPLVKGWGGLYGQGEIATFKSQLNTFALVWTKAQKIVGPWYTDTVNREIAAEKAEEARLAAIRARQRAESEHWRALFRDRNFVGVDPGDTHD